MGTIGQFFRALAEALGFMNKRQELKNAADVKAAEIARQEQAEKEKATRIVAEKNVDETRKELSGD